MCSRDFRDVGAGFKTRRDDPCLGLGRPAPPRRPCWNDVHTRGPLTLLPFETCFECSYFISHYDTPQTRGKHSQISAYENVGRDRKSVVSGKSGVSTGRSRWSPYHEKKKDKLHNERE